MRLRGRASIPVYRAILQQLRYQPPDGQISLSTLFSLVCSGNQGSMVSNRLEKQLTVISNEDEQVLSPVGLAVESSGMDYFLDNVVSSSSGDVSRKEEVFHQVYKSKGVGTASLLASLTALLVVAVIGVLFLRNKLAKRRANYKWRVYETRNMPRREEPLLLPKLNVTGNPLLEDSQHMDDMDSVGVGRMLLRTTQQVYAPAPPPCIDHPCVRRELEGTAISSGSLSYDEDDQDDDQDEDGLIDHDDDEDEFQENYPLHTAYQNLDRESCV
ncbi:hypothetical protein Ciccas_011237 [Cichlidogyrus casuarinus]|uniref:Uncharacterized protein n=1 Tax=Cichlidogyrus casuarinus TaxID=1844966 RepID=A0ABD2PRU6_9PLAT